MGAAYGMQLYTHTGYPFSSTKCELSCHRVQCRTQDIGYFLDPFREELAMKST